MKNKFSGFAIICLVIFALASCKKPVSQLALFIPKDASVVFTVDTKAITDKIASSGITIDSLVNLFAKDEDEYALHWNDIKNSGIELDQPIYIFSKQTTSVQAGNTRSAALIAQVKDVKKLEAFLKKERVGRNVLSGGKYQYMALGEDYIAGWTDKILIVSVVTGGTYAPGTYSTGEGTLSQLQLTTLFTQNESASIASVGNFRDMLAKPGDIHFYTNTSVNMGQLAILGMTKANSLLEGSYSDGIINFDKGKIIVSTETHNNKTLSDILEKYPSKEIDKDMITGYPDSVSAFGIISFNTKVLIDILHYLGFDMMADGYASEMGFTVNDVFNAFSGDIAFIFSSARTKSLEDQFGNQNPLDGRFLLNMRIGDKAAFDKVIKGLTDKKILSKNGDEYQFGLFGGHNFTIEATGNELLIGSSDELIKTYEAGKNKATLPGDIEKEMSNKSMAMYADINTMLKNSNISDSANRMVLTTALSTFKNFVATTEKSDGKTVKGNLELDFININENSLASLAKFIAVVHREEIDRKKDWTAYPPSSGQQDTDSLPANKDDQ